MSGKTSLEGQKNAWQTGQQEELGGAGTHVWSVPLPPKVSQNSCCVCLVVQCGPRDNLPSRAIER